VVDLADEFTIQKPIPVKGLGIQNDVLGQTALDPSAVDPCDLSILLAEKQAFAIELFLNEELGCFQQGFQPLIGYGIQKLGKDPRGFAAGHCVPFDGISLPVTLGHLLCHKAVKDALGHMEGNGVTGFGTAGESRSSAPVGEVDHEALTAWDEFHPVYFVRAVVPITETDVFHTVDVDTRKGRECDLHPPALFLLVDVVTDAPATPRRPGQ